MYVCMYIYICVCVCMFMDWLFENGMNWLSTTTTPGGPDCLYLKTAKNQRDTGRIQLLKPGS